MFLSDEGPTLETLDYTIYIGTNLFIFRFVSLLCLRSTLRLFHLYLKNNGDSPGVARASFFKGIRGLLSGSTQE